jgi:hypothetical protein
MGNSHLSNYCFYYHTIILILSSIWSSFDDTEIFLKKK